MIAKLKRLLNGIEQAGVLGARCQALEKENDDLAARNAILWNDYKTKNEEAQATAKKLAEVNEKLRIQTEADLVLTSLKIIQGAMRGETVRDLSGLASMQAQQMAMLQRGGGSGNYAGVGYLGSLGSALGLGR